jgi:hypothetical protein
VMPRTTDELRPIDKPKDTYEGRVLPGKSRQQNLNYDVPVQEKRRPDTFIARDHDYYVPTTGAYLGNAPRSEPIDRKTARQDTTREYSGAAYSGKNNTIVKGEVAQSRKNVLQELQVNPAYLVAKGNQAKDDKGRSSILIYSNERDTTSANVYAGNLTSAVKSITAPILDMMRPNRGSCPHIVMNPRADGNIKGPTRTRVYDPADVMRTTIKEGLVDSSTGPNNIRGPIRTYVHDSSDILKTTMRQVTNDDTGAVNLKVSSNATYVKDPHDVLRTTIRETMIDDDSAGNIKSQRSTYVKDPRDVPRTTLKESMTDEEYGAVNLRGPKRVYVHDPEDVTRTTMREVATEDGGNTMITTHEHRSNVRNDYVPITLRDTLEDLEYSMFTGDKKHRVHDPEDVMKTTVKETTTVEGQEHGTVTMENPRGAYVDMVVDAKRTNKETATGEYYGTGKRDMGQGHLTAPRDLRETVREVTSDNEYFGPTMSTVNKRPTSHEDYENANVNETKELTLLGRDPTRQGPKNAVGTESVHVTHNRQPLADYGTIEDDMNKISRSFRDNIVAEGTRDRNLYDEDRADRFDEQVALSLEQLADNAFNIDVAH